MKYSNEGLRKEIENQVKMLEIGAEHARKAFENSTVPVLNQMVGAATVISLTCLCLSSNDVLLDLKERVDNEKKKGKMSFSNPVIPADFKFPNVNGGERA